MEPVMKSMFLKNIFCFCVITLSVQTNAQSLTKPLSLSNAVSLALGRYPSIKAGRADVDAANAVLRETQHAWLPSVKLNEQVDAGTDNSLNSAYFPMGIVPSASGGRRQANNSQASLGNLATVFGQWEVYNFGGYAARTNEAKAALHVNEAGLHVEEYRIQSAVIQNYLDLIRYESLIAVQLQNIQRTDTIRNAIKAYVNSGLKAGVDSSVAEAELSKARLNYLELNNSLSQVKNQLSVLTGLDSAVIKGDTAVNASVNEVLLHQLPVDPEKIQHPVLDYYHAIYEDNIARQNIIRKSYLPKINVMAAGWMRGSSISPEDVYDKNVLNGLSYTRYNYLAGLSITYDLFDVRRARYKLDEQQFLSQAALANFQEQTEQINSSVTEANINIRTAINRLREIPIQQNAANGTYQQKLALYNAGLTNIVDLTNALYLLNRAETDAILATDSAWKALFQKAYATNTLNQLLSIFK